MKLLVHELSNYFWPSENMELCVKGVVIPKKKTNSFFFWKAWIYAETLQVNHMLIVCFKIHCSCV